jgi:hypothetical protein
MFTMRYESLSFDTFHELCNIFIIVIVWEHYFIKLIGLIPINDFR